MSLRVCEAHGLKPVEEWLTEGARVCGRPEGAHGLKPVEEWLTEGARVCNRPAGAHGLKPVTQGVWGELTG